MSRFYAAKSKSGLPIVVCESFGIKGDKVVRAIDVAASMPAAKVKAESWQALYDNSDYGMKEAA